MKNFDFFPEPSFQRIIGASGREYYAPDTRAYSWKIEEALPRRTGVRKRLTADAVKLRSCGVSPLRYRENVRFTYVKKLERSSAEDGHHGCTMKGFALACG